MNAGLRHEWTRRLEAAQRDGSWRSRVEARVLEFLLRRYDAAPGPAPVPDRAFYRGEAPHGRGKMLLSTEQRSERLKHIAAVRSETPDDGPFVSQMKRALDSSIYEAMTRNQRAQREREKRLERWQRRKERGYW